MSALIRYVADVVVDCDEKFGLGSPGKRAAVIARATLEYLRDHVSEQINDAGVVAIDDAMMFEDGDFEMLEIEAGKKAFRAMLSAALDELEGTK